MIDFHEGWDLRNRLIEDNKWDKNFDNLKGIDLELKIVELATKFYDYEKPAPSKEVGSLDLDFLKGQSANDRLHFIWEIGSDWDGYRTIRGLGSLLDEILDCVITDCKTEKQIVEEIILANKYSNIEDFLNYLILKSDSIIYSFSVENFKKIINWGEENNHKVTFLGYNYDNNGNIIANIFKIEK